MIAVILQLHIMHDLHHRTRSLLSTCVYISTGRPHVPNNEVRLTADAHVMMFTIFYCYAY